ncbi:VOC family protein [Microvirga arsenatis]|uniref:Glyoxalase n=1 Tax=Microvirga arsenatis TaxID=2692265 RepID=A0ABW9Z4A3_9HYPH|nr:VOC family protein [Microvirga arsenatis]NBJ13005.1 glyoxalase [Microvirga arsenatis]NBJ26771.1 glyoxalase [Microvirga arsenatis]
MLIPNLILLYVDNPERSAAFYERLFAAPPAAVLPTYVAFEFENGLTFSLWSTSAKNFVSGGSGHRSEIAFMVPEDQMVRELHERWRQDGVTLEQPLHEAVFGLTFVAVDPDGHRIRVCTPDG